ncbi:MAG: hypothetical protein N2376_14715 [Clostridia bacterium]|nr:hypothetical protein [Clostridia bacterium]
MGNIGKQAAFILMTALLLLTGGSTAYAETSSLTSSIPNVASGGDIKDISYAQNNAIDYANGAIEPYPLNITGTGVKLELSERLERNTTMALETRETYDVSGDGKHWGQLVYDTYAFKNGDLYYLLNYTATSNQAGDLTICLPEALETFDIRMIQYPKGLDFSKSVFQSYPGQTAQANVLTSSSPSAVYIDSLSLNAYMSYTSVYEKQAHGVRKEHYDQGRNIGVTQGAIEVVLPACSTGFSEQWGIVSRQALVNWDNTTVVGELRVGDLNRVRKWGMDGQYYTMPTTYRPYSAASFYRNNANHIGEKFIRVNGGRFFKDFGFIALDTLIKTQNQEGYWGTGPRSEWLYKNYKAGAYFYDTRFDTDAALFLLRGYRHFNEPRALVSAERYAQYFLGYAQNHAFKSKSGGLLIYDYGYDAIPGIKTHASLNHLLNEMNFLLEMYMTTKDEAYSTIAQKILKAVKDTAPNWVNKSSGDLHYAYLPNGRYGMQDYPTLTLYDLWYSKDLVNRALSIQEPVIQKLIDAKEKYLKLHQIAF